MDNARVTGLPRRRPTLRRMPRTLELALAGMLLPAASTAASAQDFDPLGELPSTLLATEQGPPDGPRTGRSADILIAPVPFTSPTTGFGVAGGVVAFYNPDGGPRQWISGVGAVWTSRGTRGIGGYHEMSLGGDRVRVNALLSYARAASRYWGIGATDGDRGDALELRNRTLEARINAQTRIFPRGFGGIRYRLVTNNAEPTGAVDETQPPPAAELDSRLSMVGPTFTYDSRDSGTQPRQGFFGTAAWLVGFPALGNSFSHNKLTLAGSFYAPVARRSVIAINARVCAAGGDVPFYDLCLFGSDAALRGYPGGRYRDRASWATQVELRQQLSGRWGGTAFVGVGGIAPSADRLVSQSNLLPAAGVGARYRPFEDNDVQIRVDVAFGRDSRGLYLSIGEAF